MPPPMARLATLPAADVAVESTFALPPPPPLPSADVGGAWAVAEPDLSDDDVAAAMKPSLGAKLGAVKDAAVRALGTARDGVKSLRRGSQPRVIRSKLGPWVLPAPKTSGELMMERIKAFASSPIGAVLIAAISVSMIFCTVVIVLSESTAEAMALAKPTDPKAPPPIAAPPPALPVVPVDTAPTSAPVVQESRAERAPARRRVRRSRRGRGRAVARRGGRNRGRQQVASRSTSSSPRGSRGSSSAARDIAALLGN
jgi:hypothetical protein